MRKRQFKKVLSLVLALAMVFTMNTSVFATGINDPAPAADPVVEEPAAEENAEAPVTNDEKTVEETKEETPVSTSEETPAPKAEAQPEEAVGTAPTGIVVTGGEEGTAYSWGTGEQANEITVESEQAVTIACNTAAAVAIKVSGSGTATLTAGTVKIGASSVEESGTLVGEVSLASKTNAIAADVIVDDDASEGLVIADGYSVYEYADGSYTAKNAEAVHALSTIGTGAYYAVKEGTFYAVNTVSKKANTQTKPETEGITVAINEGKTQATITDVGKHEYYVTTDAAVPDRTTAAGGVTDKKFGVTPGNTYHLYVKTAADATHYSSDWSDAIDVVVAGAGTKLAKPIIGTDADKPVSVTGKVNKIEIVSKNGVYTDKANGYLYYSVVEKDGTPSTYTIIRDEKTVSVDNLEPGEYDVYVMAKPIDPEGGYTDSDADKTTVEVYDEAGVVDTKNIKLTKITATKGLTVTVSSSMVNDGKTFIYVQSGSVKEDPDAKTVATGLNPDDASVDIDLSGLTGSLSFNVYAVSTNGQTAEGRVDYSDVVKLNSSLLYGVSNYKYGIVSKNATADYITDKKIADLFGITLSVNAILGDGTIVKLPSNTIYDVPFTDKWDSSGVGSVSQVTAGTVGFHNGDEIAITPVVSIAGESPAAFDGQDKIKIKFNKAVAYLSVDGITVNDNTKKVESVTVKVVDPATGSTVGGVSGRTVLPSAYKYITILPENVTLSTDTVFKAGTHYAKVTTASTDLIADADDLAAIGTAGFRITKDSTQHDNGTRLEVGVTPEDKATLTLTEATVEYGTATTNNSTIGAEDYLSKLLKATLQASGNTISTNVYDITYKFTTSADQVKKTTISQADFDAVKTDDSYAGNLQSFKAGDKVYILAQANYGGIPVAWTVINTTIAKRKIWLYSTKSMSTDRGTPLTEKELSSNNVSEVQAFLLKGVTNYAGDPTLHVYPTGNNTMLSANATTGLAYRVDDSGVDYNKADTYTAGLKKGTWQLQTAYDKNFEVVETQAEIEVKHLYKANFYILFNGNSKSVSSCSINAAGKLIGWNNEYTLSFNGAIPTGASLTWYDEDNNYINIYNEMDLRKEVYDYKKGDLVYVYSDRIITGVVTIGVTGGDTIKAQSILPVTYDGRSHFLSMDSKKKESASSVKDVGLYIYDTQKRDEEGDYYYLVAGKDYTVKYLNNKNASVKYDEKTGEYVPLYTSDKKRPQVVVTGKGDYKGMKLTAYYNILPMNIEEGYYTWRDDSQYDLWFGNSRINGLKTAYKANKKGVVKYSYKVLRTKYDYKKDKSTNLTLKKGEKKDYTEQLYKYTKDEGGNAYWEKVSAVAGEGSYMLTVNGVNNYCGTIPTYFVAKGNAPSKENYFGDNSAGQFKVVSANVLDMAKAKVTLNKTKPAFAEGKTVSADAFISSVKIGKTTVNKEWYDAYIYEDNKGNGYQGKETGNAGTMYIKLVANGKALENNIFGESKYVKVQVTGGIKLKKSQFKLQVSENGKFVDAPSSKVYDAKTIRLSVSGDNLGANKDYTTNMTLTDGRYISDITSAGKRTYTIKGKGKYTGSVKLTFNIKKASIQKVLNTDVLKVTAVAKTGANINGTPTTVSVTQNKVGKGSVTFANGYEDIATLRFTLTKNTKAGTAVVTVKPLNKDSNFSGSGKVEYTIAQKKVTSVSDLSAAQNANALKAGEVYATLEDVLYKEKGNFDPKLKLYQVANDGKNFKPLKAKTDYVFTTTHEVSVNTVTVTNSGKANSSFDFGSKGVKIDPVFNTYLKKITKVVLTVSSDYIDEYGKVVKLTKCDNGGQKYEAEYTGLSVTPEVLEATVYSGSESQTFKAASGNFAVSYLNNVNAGKKAQIVINMKSPDKKKQYDIGGSKAVKFVIVPQKEKTTILTK